MKKKIILAIITAVICTVSCFAFVGCSNTNPIKFLEKFDEANKYTLITYAPDKESTKIVTIRRNNRDTSLLVPMLYDYYAFGTANGYEIYEGVGAINYKVYESPKIPFQDKIDKNKADIIKEFVPNYEKGAIAKDALKDKFQKNDGKWYLLNADGTVIEDFGYIIMDKGAFIAYNKDDILRYSLKLSCGDIERPETK